jgi:uncharacterized 2Fe-2S/4Fe-4S cluster protein (DUF4445 family)
MSLNPIAFLRSVRLQRPSSSDKTADAGRLLQALGKTGLTRVTMDLGVLRRLSGELRKNEFCADVVIGLGGSGLKILDIGREKIYGLAFDIGSTNIECCLFDLVEGKKMDEAGIENPQVQFGNDVLTRVQKSMMGDFRILAQSLMDGINALVQNICARSAISADDIFAVTVAGNTIMSHFFLGLDVDNIPINPYIPVVNSSVFADAGEIGLKVNKHAVVYVFPNSGSYVGGDIISGIISSGIYREEEPALFIDVGTNAEITLGCREWVMVGAGAAGPALEGGVASIGKKAEAGAIAKVKIDRSSGEMKIEVISGVEPSGICGSGLIDLVSEMFSAGIIDQSGKFTGSGKGVVERSGNKAYLIYKSDKTELFLTEAEIKNFLLSKAAMFSFLYVFVRSVGLTFKDIKKVYIAGALGCGIDPGKAITIGMLPDMPRERFIPLGNASLMGAEMVLLNRDFLKDIDDVSKKITYREMNEDPELMSLLQGAMFIPHTEPDILKG